MSRIKKTQLKQCPQCKSTFTLDNFYKNHSSADGHQTLCKSCFNIRYAKVKSPKVKSPKVKLPSTTNKSPVVTNQSHKFDNLYTTIPFNTPFTIKDLLTHLNLDPTDRNRSKLQQQLYALINSNLIEKTGKLHTGLNIYIKKSSEVKHLTFEPRRCIKCDEPLLITDLSVNPNAKICTKCSTAITTTTTALSTPLNDDVERITTLLHNELTLLNSKLNGNHDIIAKLNTINSNLEKLQMQNRTLIKIFASNCRTIPSDVTLDI